MARGTKSNVLKFKAKPRSVKAAKATPETESPRVARKKTEKPVEATEVVAKPVAAKAPELPTSEVKPASTDKKVSQKLLETIERRKKIQGKGGQMFSKPPGRRGRRPKAAAEYVPTNNEEESAYVLESDYEGIEYDTGIKMKEGGDDKGFSLDRFDDYDEELNFDW